MSEWWQDDDNILQLIRWMADNPAYDKHDLAAMIEKPWKYGDEWLTCQVQETLEEIEHPFPF